MSACDTTTAANIVSKDAFQAWAGRKQTTLEGTSAVAQLPTLQADIFNTGNCLNERIRDISTLSTADSNQQLKVESLQKQIAEEEKNLEIANQRLLSVKNNTTSFYEGWFPIERDIRPGSAAILLGFSVAFYFISLAYLLQFVGVYIFVQRIGDNPSLLLSAMMQQFTFSFWVLLVVLIGVVLYFVYK